MILECVDGPLDGHQEEIMDCESIPKDGDVRVFMQPNWKRREHYLVVDGKLLWSQSRLLWKAA